MILVLSIIFLSGCSLIEVEITHSDDENYSSNQTIIDDVGNLSEHSPQMYLQELISVNNLDVVYNEDKIWSYYYDEENYLHFVLLDAKGNIIDDKKSIITREDYINFIKVLDNDYAFINGTIGNEITAKDYVFDLTSLEEITNKFLSDNEKIWYVEKGGNVVIKSKTEETYNDLIITITIMDEYANVKSEFSSTEFESEYNRNWYLRNPSIYSADNGIYVFNIDDDYLGVIDSIHNKFIIVNHGGISRYIDAMEDRHFEIFSDGKYLVFYSNYMGYGNYLFDLINESFVKIGNNYSIVYMDSMDANSSHYYDRAWRTSFGDGKIYCANRDSNYAFVDIATGKIINLEFDGAKPSKVGPFTNGYAVIEFKGKYVTIIDENGNMLFEPIDGNINKAYGFSIEFDNQVYFNVTNHGEYYLLDINGNKININDDNYNFTDESSKACRFISYEGSDIFLVDYYGTNNFEFSRTQIK